jgi:hypothetical protein
MKTSKTRFFSINFAFNRWEQWADKWKRSDAEHNRISSKVRMETRTYSLFLVLHECVSTVYCLYPVIAIISLRGSVFVNRISFVSWRARRVKRNQDMSLPHQQREGKEEDEMYHSTPSPILLTVVLFERVAEKNVGASEITPRRLSYFRPQDMQLRYSLGSATLLWAEWINIVLKSTQWRRQRHSDEKNDRALKERWLHSTSDCYSHSRIVRRGDWSLTII